MGFFTFGDRMLGLGVLPSLVFPMLSQDSGRHSRLQVQLHQLVFQRSATRITILCWSSPSLLCPGCLCVRESCQFQNLILGVHPRIAPGSSHLWHPCITLLLANVGRFWQSFCPRPWCVLMVFGSEEKEKSQRLQIAWAKLQRTPPSFR